MLDSNTHTKKGHSNILNSEIHVFILYLDTFLQYMFYLLSLQQNLENVQFYDTNTGLFW